MSLENLHAPSVFDILMLTVVTPMDAVPRVIFSRVAVFTKMPGVLVGSAMSSCLVTVIAPVRVVATAMAVCVSVLYELLDDPDAATTMEAPVSCAEVHFTNMAVVDVPSSAITCVFVVAYVPSFVSQNRHPPLSALMLIVTVVAPPVDASERVIFSCVARFFKMPGLLVGSALSSCLVTVMDPLSGVSTAMAACVNVLYELTDAPDTVTTMDAPDACPAAHLMYMSVVSVMDSIT